MCPIHIWRCLAFIVENDLHEKNHGSWGERNSYVQAYQRQESFGSINSFIKIPCNFPTPILSCSHIACYGRQPGRAKIHFKERYKMALASVDTPRSTQILQIYHFCGTNLFLLPQRKKIWGKKIQATFCADLHGCKSIATPMRAG